MSLPATKRRGSIDRRSGGCEPSTDLFASGGRRGRARPSRAPPDFDSVSLFVGGDHGDVAVGDVAVAGDVAVVGDAVGAGPGPGRQPVEPG